MENKGVKKVLISFSAGETSAWMTYYLLRVKYKCVWDDTLQLHVGFDEETEEVVHAIVTFANTGQENEETLVFARECDTHFGFNSVWLEAVPRFKIGGVVLKVAENLDKALNTNWFGSRLSTTHKVVNFETANRDGLVYESAIARYGIFNRNNPGCTRELKLRPMSSYVKSRGWKTGTYYSAVGLRIDEMDRINEDHKELKLLYPAITMRPMSKPQINGFWVLQPFRLMLKGYQGNCKWCFKKSMDKLWQLARESPEIFEFPKKIEEKYGAYITPDRLREMVKRSKPIPSKKDRVFTFFRGNRSASDILEQAKDTTKQVVDDSEIYETESCEVYSNCGDN
jgi:3'-phosphoadenosine 5'-phosphosulfate sulfotransferase (PAPS reductase)/FAD synthetase